jgi:hypothetical protein
MRSGEDPLRIAIVGVGPKGLYCFERLVAHARRSRRPLEIDLFEPTGEFGAGAVYSGTQPDCLSMNFADELIDAWPADSRPAADAQDACTYAEWLGRNAPGLDSRDEGDTAWPGYSPRVRVGDYLADCFQAVLRAVPGNVRVHTRIATVDRIASEGAGWKVESTGGDRRDAVVRCDEVMLALGHNPTPQTPGGLALSYPAGSELGPTAIPPGAQVRVRGMALTAIDLALMLTEGRGGRFVADARPGRLRYLPAGAEPGGITLGSRTGRTPSVKPDPARFARLAGMAGARRRGLERLAELDALSVEFDLVPELGRTAAQLLAATGVVDPDRIPAAGARCAAALRVRLEPRFETPHAARRRLAASLAVATGARPPDVLWALGEAWRCLYPAIVELGSHGGVDSDEWPQFAVLAREMERLAFGPPPVAAAKLLALIDAGIVRFSDEPFVRQENPGQGPLVDAVLAPPGPPPEPAGLVAGLIGAGHARVAPGGRRGIEVGPSAACVGRSGASSAGLSAVGRLTEDWVIGNDTLSRRLHSHPDRWARRVVGAS